MQVWLWGVFNHFSFLTTNTICYCHWNWWRKRCAGWCFREQFQCVSHVYQNIWSIICPSYAGECVKQNIMVVANFLNLLSGCNSIYIFLLVACFYNFWYIKLYKLLYSGGKSSMFTFNLLTSVLRVYTIIFSYCEFHF